MGNSIYWGKYRSKVSHELARYVPESWRVSVSNLSEAGKPDALAHIKAADGTETEVAIEFKTKLTPSSATLALAELRDNAPQTLLVAPSISRATQRYLRERNVSYLDFTGNVYWKISRPALYVSVQSSEQPEKSETRDRRLTGAKAGRLMRYLCDFQPPFTVTSLSEAVEMDPGNVSRYLEVLQRDGIINRVGRGPVTGVDWEALLRRWSDDYRRPLQEQYHDPRGQSHFIRALKDCSSRYVLSGTSAAVTYAPYSVDVAPFCYCDDMSAFANSLGIRPAARGSNVILALPFDDVVYERRQIKDGTLVASPSQVAIDLLIGRGRELQQGEHLMTWMRDHTDAWRT
ncbi:MAG: ArsR family transcriptional regulator [Candidatus Eremiobacteraeota bacterium]|nr:ArsR family transcriptional regulator [Candidatus Eremiobacteraeota bacterium]